jgi:hypothetical protein
MNEYSSLIHSPLVIYVGCYLFSCKIDVMNIFIDTQAKIERPSQCPPSLPTKSIKTLPKELNEKEKKVQTITRVSICPLWRVQILRHQRTLMGVRASLACQEGK